MKTHRFKVINDFGKGYCRYQAQSGKPDVSSGLALTMPYKKFYLSFIATVALTLSLFAAPAKATEEISDQSVAAQFDELFQKAQNNEVELTTIHHLVLFLESLKKKIPQGDDKRRRQYQYYACLAGYEFDMDESEVAIQRYIDEAHAAGDKEAEARFYYCLSHYQSTLSRWQAGIKSSSKAIELAREVNNFKLTAMGLASRCTMASLIGQYANSLADCLETKDIYQAIGDKRAAKKVLYDIGVAYRRVGFFDKAMEFFDELESYAKEKKDPLGVVQTRLQKSYIYQAREKHFKALELQNSALSFADEHQVPFENGSIHIAKASSLNALARYQDALKELEQAEIFFKRQGISGKDEMVVLQRGLAFAGLEQAEQAHEFFQTAEHLMLKSGNDRYLVWVYEAQAENFRVLGQHEKAVEALNKHKELIAQLNQEKNQQQTLVLRYQFDSERQAMENKRLIAEQKLKNKELESLKKARQWQGVAIILGSILTLFLLILVVRQLLLSRRFKKLALTDSLTGAANRRHIEQYCNDAISMADSNRSAASVVVFDIDHFKQVNDEFGHAVGDQVLKELVHFCNTALRNDDRLGRYGGEEFIIVLPNTELAQAYRVAERLRTDVEGMIFEGDEVPLKITISLGVAEYARGESMKALIERADQALYRAKDQGRNQSVKM